VGGLSIIHRIRGIAGVLALCVVTAWGGAEPEFTGNEHLDGRLLRRALPIPPKDADAAAVACSLENPESCEACQ